MNNLQAMVMGFQLSLVGMFLASDSHILLTGNPKSDGHLGYLLILVGLGISLYTYFQGEPPSER